MSKVVNSERDWLQRESREWAGGPSIVSFITGLKSTCRKVSFDRNTPRWNFSLGFEKQTTSYDEIEYAVSREHHQKLGDAATVPHKQAPASPLGCGPPLLQLRVWKLDSDKPGLMQWQLILGSRSRR